MLFVITELKRHILLPFFLASLSSTASEHPALNINLYWLGVVSIAFGVFGLLCGISYWAMLAMDRRATEGSAKSVVNRMGTR
jgi:hypothetical protein